MKIYWQQLCKILALQYIFTNILYGWNDQAYWTMVKDHQAIAVIIMATTAQRVNSSVVATNCRFCRANVHAGPMYYSYAHDRSWPILNGPDALQQIVRRPLPANLVNGNCSGNGSWGKLWRRLVVSAVGGAPSLLASTYHVEGQGKGNTNTNAEKKTN